MYTTDDKIIMLFGDKNVPPAKFRQVWEMFGSGERLISELPRSKEAAELLEAAYRPLCSALANGECDRLADKMERNGVTAVNMFSLPRCFGDLVEAPYVLFCRGNTALLDSDCFSVVGTRKVSSYGKRVAQDFTEALSKDFTIVSGLAYGVDAIAHETALQSGGSTIAVLGGGLINVYPAANQYLADRIAGGNGLLVSEYGMDAPSFAYHFPHRNRLVAALGRGLLVCQAAEKSGTNSTVEWAVELGRDVFAVPGEIYDRSFGGNNKLIKNGTAMCVTSPEDIADYYGVGYKANVKESYQISIEEQAIVDALTLGPLTFDEIVRKTSINSATLNFLLANLEIRSIIARLPGNSYRLYGGIE